MWVVVKIIYINIKRKAGSRRYLLYHSYAGYTRALLYFVELGIRTNFTLCCRQGASQRVSEFELNQLLECHGWKAQAKGEKMEKDEEEGRSDMAKVSSKSRTIGRVFFES